MDHSLIQSGTYFIIIHLPRTTSLTIGKLGLITFKRGYYVYVGSAMGSGGLRGRVKRHLSDGKKLHWHIDHLLMAGGEADVNGSGEREGNEERATVIRKVFVLPTGERQECPAARHISEILEQVLKFGCSDCSCESHLFHGKRLRDVEQAVRLYSKKIVTWNDFSRDR